MQLELEIGTDAPSESLNVEVSDFSIGDVTVPLSRGEFWTAKQRDGHSIHEISYRACYKPQLPGYFLKHYASPGSLVFDPFLGRGTTLVEARLAGCRTAGSDVNPLSIFLTRPRLRPPTLAQVKQRLDAVILPEGADAPEGMLEFFHPATLEEITGWMGYFRQRRESGLLDDADEWIQMVAINRLTGHSNGFFSVYTLPPNQAVSIARQAKINAKLRQVPEHRDTRALIWKKTRSLLRDSLPEGFRERELHVFQASADRLLQMDSSTVDLVVTSPPFLNEVDYLQDNWMRMWFCGISLDRASLWQIRSVAEWTAQMEGVLKELRRILKTGGVVAFEVGEVRKGTVRLEIEVLAAGLRAGLTPISILVNEQNFTKTSNCWGVSNNASGTNTNRIVVFRKT